MKVQPAQPAPKHTTRDILEALNIQSIYWIDDQFSKQTNHPIHQKQSCVSALCQLVAEGNIDRVKEIFEEKNIHDLEISINMSQEILQEVFISKISDEDINFFLEKLELTEDLTPSNFKNISTVLKNAVSEAAEGVSENYREFSGLAWRQEEATLKSKSNTIFMVDYSFQDEEPEFIGDGADIIATLLQSLHPTSLCFLLTHEKKPGQEEEDLRKNILKKKIIDDDKKILFSVISKSHLIAANDNNDLQDQLGHIIKSIYLRQKNIGLLKEVRKCMDEALNELSEELMFAPAYSLEKVIFRSSMKEGASEIDLLKRLVKVKTNQAFTKALENPTIIKKINSIRQVAYIKNNNVDKAIEEFYSNENFKYYREAELFDDSINKTHSPLEPGDIFYFGTEPDNLQKYILIAQGCDLLIRQDGKRKIEYAFLLNFEEIENKSTKDLAKELYGKKTNTITKKIERYLKKSPYSTESYFINTVDSKKLQIGLNSSKTMLIHLKYLDLCVFNKDGTLSIDLTLELKEIEKSLHLDSLRKLFIILIEDIENKKHQGKTDKINLVTHENFNAEFIWDKNEQVFILPNARRVKRLKEPYINELIDKFYRYQSRTGFEHDFTI